MARIAEDEARGADSHNLRSWHESGCSIHPQGLEETWCDCDVPARVLAECEAKRRIVMRHVSIDGRCLGCGMETAGIDPLGFGTFSRPCPELRYLAAVCADHPDFQESWRV